MAARRRGRRLSGGAGGGYPAAVAPDAAFCRQRAKGCPDAAFAGNGYLRVAVVVVARRAGVGAARRRSSAAVLAGSEYVQQKNLGQSTDQGRT